MNSRRDTEIDSAGAHKRCFAVLIFFYEHISKLFKIVYVLRSTGYEYLIGDRYSFIDARMRT